ncbi:MAG: insulinase family protein [Phycisphaerales bacterium]|nr:MAG: insulinase family protein [Phycisphaerales bacterium]
MIETRHEFLECGVEMAAAFLPDRRVVHFEFRLYAGAAHEPSERLGLAHLVEETVTKGTERRSGRELSDAFDAIGASHSTWTGRECAGFGSTCLPEYLEEALGLHAEFLRTPTFPEDACSVAVELAEQEINSLNDEPRDLCDKLLARQTYGEVLGRHVLGEPETLKRITRQDIAGFWQRMYVPGRMQLVLAGPVDWERTKACVESLFAGCGGAKSSGREPFTFQFNAQRAHHQQETEQEQIGVCYPGVAVPSREFPIERVLLGVLSGGMSSRLFTEVREKLGLVYYVQAWSEHPRGAGMIHIAASTTPERCAETYATLLREISRLADDVTEEELERAKTGLLARAETRGETTSARCAELGNDLFHYGHPVSREEKLDAIREVSVEDIRRYLHEHPRDQLSVLTLGPSQLEV